MIKEFRLPELGENIEGGDVVQIHVSKGDPIKKDQIVLEIETDKATIEVPSPFDGRVKDIHVKSGAVAEVGQLIITVDAEAGDAAETAPEKPAAVAAVSPTPSAEPAQPPATEPAAPAEVKVPAAPAAPAPPLRQPGDRPKKLAPAAPSVRRFAREIGVDIGAVPGTGPGGRISIEDVKRYSRDVNARKTGNLPGVAAAPLPDFSKWGEISREQMSNVRKSTVASMSRSWQTVAHVTNHDKADVTELEKLRKNFAPQAEAFGTKLTMTAILIKVLAAALKRFPKFNTSIDTEKNEIIYKKYINIGVAVDTERGLLVPVVRAADQKNILEIAGEMNELAGRARNRKLGVDEMNGGTFTITNLGGIGGTSFTPIVNWPEVAIMGVSRTQHEPKLADGHFEPRLMLPLSLSYDHRIIDGADAARFLRWVATALEQPFMIALEG